MINLFNKPFTIKMKLTLWYIGILALVLIVFSSLLFLNIKQDIYSEVENHLQIQASELLSRVNESEVNNTKTYLINLSNTIEDIIPPNFKIGVYDVDFNIIQNNQYKNIITNDITNSKQNSFIIKNSIGSSQKWAIFTRPIYKNNKIIGLFKLAYNLEKEQNTLHNLFLFILIGIPITLILAIGGGYFLAAKALNPIKNITKTANVISSNNLSQRITEKDTNDEIQNLIITLNHLFNRLESAFITEKRFTDDASHELRTPISVIKAHTEKALNKNYSKEEYKKIFKIIKRQTDYMNHLIEQLLLVARSENEENFLKKEFLNLTELINIVIAEMKEKALSNNVKIISKIEDKINIYGDQSMLVQLLINLIDNAIKYSKEEGEILITATKEKGYVVIKIKDNGVGISEEDQKHIFESFYRVDKSRSRQNGGTGLGLAICKRITESHNGNIKVKSKINKGSTFTINLPLKQKKDY